ncbi:uncharacterized protein H6S33_004487 [Morchella sextelata]|uniref:uncharacterized protein n=1 Tax=Morchella sextelata TaxID=1174677 RepID=UPI001D03E51F|nr:uncharacterized protein H6S33_004487 [Morchella sextelata]KAH0606030.1 hypothetical protein H6S33_004487 [Morchella sextelata]
MAMNSEPACVGTSAASNSHSYICPLFIFYQSIGEKPHNDCVKGRFSTLKLFIRHIQRLHLKQMRCTKCSLRLGYDMNRHVKNNCKGKDSYREPEVPKKVIDLHKSLKGKNFQEIKDILIKGREVVYDYQKEPQSIKIDEDEDEDPSIEESAIKTAEDEDEDHFIKESAIGLPLPGTAVWRNGQWESEDHDISSPIAY